MTFPSASTADVPPSEEGPLGNVADRFRDQVTRELATIAAPEREGLRGDYVFLIDGAPRFVVTLAREVALSAPFGVAYGDPVAARARIHTDGPTLSRLLAGTMKAKAAFLAGRVRIEGDLPGFLRLIGLLKARGVTPPGPSSLAAV